MFINFLDLKEARKYIQMIDYALNICQSYILARFGNIGCM